MRRYHISGVPIAAADGRLVGILTNRDLRFEDDDSLPVSELMTSEDLVTAPVGTTLEQAEEILHRAQDREAPGRRRRRPPARADHGQGHPEAARSSRTRRRTSAAGCASAPRSASGPTRSSARRRSSTPTSTCSSSTPRTATRSRWSRWCAGSRTRSGIEVIAGNVATGEATRGADRRRRRRREGRRRAPVRSAPPAWSPASACRRSPRSSTARRRPTAASRDRRRRAHLLGRHREGDRGRRRRGHARLDARRHRRGARRGDRRAGRALQGVPRHGLARRDEGPRLLEGPLLPGRRRGRREADPRGHRGPRPVQGPRSGRSSTSSSAACARRWATAAPRRSRS